MLLETGGRLGPYEILDPLGEGGMGEVWRARDTRLDRTVAIKKSALRFSDRFEREARAIAALNHPHICTLYVERLHAADVRGRMHPRTGSDRGPGSNGSE